MERSLVGTQYLQVSIPGHSASGPWQEMTCWPVAIFPSDILGKYTQPNPKISRNWFSWSGTPASLRTKQPHTPPRAACYPTPAHFVPTLQTEDFLGNVCVFRFPSPLQLYLENPLLTYGSLSCLQLNGPSSPLLQDWERRGGIGAWASGDLLLGKLQGGDS